MLSFSLNPNVNIACLEPRSNHVLVEMVEASSNSVLCQAQHDHTVVYGTVVSMPKSELKNTEITFQKHIMFMKEHGARMMINEKEYRIIREDLVLAICS